MKENLRVVVVDDSRLMRKLVIRMLSLIDGVDVVGTAGNGEEAIHVIGQVTPHLVLMDIVMPKMDGLAALDLIRRRFPDVRVAMVSSCAGSQRGAVALHHGAVQVLSKPCDPEQLAALVESEQAYREG